MKGFRWKPPEMEEGKEGRRPMVLRRRTNIAHLANEEDQKILEKKQENRNVPHNNITPSPAHIEITYSKPRLPAPEQEIDAVSFELEETQCFWGRSMNPERAVHSRASERRGTENEARMSSDKRRESFQASPNASRVDESWKRDQEEIGRRYQEGMISSPLQYKRTAEFDNELSSHQQSQFNLTHHFTRSSCYPIDLNDSKPCPRRILRAIRRHQTILLGGMTCPGTFLMPFEGWRKGTSPNDCTSTRPPR